MSDEKVFLASKARIYDGKILNFLIILKKNADFILTNLNKIILLLLNFPLLNLFYLN